MDIYGTLIKESNDRYLHLPHRADTMGKTMFIYIYDSTLIKMLGRKLQTINSLVDCYISNYRRRSDIKKFAYQMLKQLMELASRQAQIEVMHW